MREINDNPDNKQDIKETNNKEIEESRQEAIDSMEDDLAPEGDTEKPETELSSTYEERLQQTPVNNGHWDGERGESKFYSENAEANSYLQDAGVDGIEYENAIPDFSEVSKGDVKIDSMSDNRNSNFKQADQKLADEKGCSPREVADWREQNGYTWHECNDKQTCQKIPSSVNKTFGHLGGVSECKKSAEESEFDD